MTDREHIDALRKAAREARSGRVEAAREARSGRVEAIRGTFAGLPLAGRLSRLRRQDSIRVSLSDFEAIHARVVELTALVAQNALVADSLPHEGWGVPGGYQPPEDPKPQLEPLGDGQIRCIEPHCNRPADPVGPVLYRCPAGHLTIHAPETEDDPA